MGGGRVTGWVPEGGVGHGGGVIPRGAVNPEEDDKPERSINNKKLSSMQKMIFTLAACFILSALAAQQTIVKDPNAQVRSVDDFHALKVATGIRLYLTQGNQRGVVVSAAYPVYRNRIHTEVKDGVLNIYYENEMGNWHDNNRKELKVYVSCIRLDGLHASSGPQLTLHRTRNPATL